ncbi:UNVERIFIED_CONTAM: hypothetical protein GTU68_004926, partial [Idotea baltica]|nr:hypothetical protein [Idotea baltica]
MRLATLKTPDGLRPVAVNTSSETPQFVDITSVDSSLPTCLKQILSSEDGLTRAKAAFETGIKDGVFITGELEAPIPDPGKVICIGLNYRDHALETNSPIPSEPVCFGKFGNTINKPDGEIRLPVVSSQVDFEAELVVVIGKRGRDISKETAFDYVAGYCNGNDVSARDWQKGRPGGQWLLGKTPDTFAPIGPWIVTVDEISDPHALNVELKLNGVVMQSGNTREFIFGIDEVIAHLTQIMTLEPGDIIFTGTP